MASTSADNVVTVKVTYDGVTRRAKMVLQDMVPSTLEDRVRSFLHLPVDAQMIVERYSDSAAAYVHLEPGNIPVYKQLYRAAKAKSKLKLRVTLKVQDEKTSPKPVSVEDVPEVAASHVNSAESKPAPAKDAAQAPATTPVDSSLPARNITVSGPSKSTPSRTFNVVDAPCERQDFESRLASLMERNLDLAIDLADQRQGRRAFLGNQPKAEDAAVDSRLANLMDRNLSLGGDIAEQRDERRAPLGKQSDSKQAAGPPNYIRSQTGVGFAVCCNSCKKTIPDAHYHCSTCDDGDYDLCCDCVDLGVTCRSNEHWLIKRVTVDGQIVNSTTETLPPKPKKAATKRPLPPSAREILAKATSAPRKLPVNSASVAEVPQRLSVTPVPALSLDPFANRWGGNMSEMRTCNSCVQERPEKDFLHCTVCPDFDLCQACFGKDNHGHHPMHGFVPAVAGTRVPVHIKAKLSPGRNQTHHAICDGCDKYITGVRHKCFDCPDWDYCADCHRNADFVHPDHLFVAIYEPITDASHLYPATQPLHVGICCDGPLCCQGKGYPAYIRGIRYKCAVCNDTDFCANCEASPSNAHNKTHPLIKFKTPVRHVSVTTSGEHQDGQRMPAMGDRSSTSSRSTETVPTAQVNAINAVQTVVDLKPLEPEVKSEEKVEEKIEPEIKKETMEQQLQAVFVRDAIPDGTIMSPDHLFEQTWVLRNDGEVAWPAGSSVKFVSGDYMGRVDSSHAARVVDLDAARESNVCETPVQPGQEICFRVILRSPSRLGKAVSFWRLSTSDGFKFGHRLWCEVNVRDIPAPSPAEPEEAQKEAVEEPEKMDSQASSQMIFPKLEKESPVASVHEETQSGPGQDKAKAENELDGSVVDEEWDDDSDEGFLTDEEYDILDASDEELLDEEQNKAAQK